MQSSYQEHTISNQVPNHSDTLRNASFFRDGPKMDRTNSTRQAGIVLAGALLLKRSGFPIHRGPVMTRHWMTFSLRHLMWVPIIVGILIVAAQSGGYERLSYVPSAGPCAPRTYNLWDVTDYPPYFRHKYWEWRTGP